MVALGLTHRAPFRGGGVQRGGWVGGSGCPRPPGLPSFRGAEMNFLVKS